MNCKELIYSRHAITKMFERQISKPEVEDVMNTGEEITGYPDDRPLPSSLILGFAGKRPIHIVVAYDENENKCILITVYEPDPEIWDADFKKRRKP